MKDYKRREHNIYALYNYDEKDLWVYIGRSIDLKRRLRQHLASARRGGEELTTPWLKKVLPLGREPQIIKIDTVWGNGFDGWCYEFIWQVVAIRDGAKLAVENQVISTKEHLPKLTRYPWMQNAVDERSLFAVQGFESFLKK
ncbi:GIY-YIG nuclease family protein [Acanthopleuribacter pedis]|uniref:GIY-YIG nuclease family protein n=1 Tax=Acanthopleuribacter pedis TaxID=442870 RepID=A0A8J7U4F5_9BACT|nr:GIY-YIG nuclease family protein [Acanthopleuribacter pedis]MBO1319378.1 GIY-YIG nuclease family protein [Acanthopleuribacter pedis]